VHQLPQRAGREPRIALAVEFEKKNFVFASTHLDHQIEAIRSDQVAALDSLFRSNSAPAVILAGDFNAVPESAPMAALSPHWLDISGESPQPTIPAEKPTRRIDYILAAPKERWKAIRSSVLEEPVASDHRPVHAILKPEL
jgi:endonuclease/exonuclease/phosphatase family metal-dependent hydrolase